MGTPSTTRRRLTRQARRAQLVDIAELLFIQRGYADVTMEDIARGAGVSRPVPYGHFTSKEGVFLACVSRARDSYETHLRAAMVTADTPEGKVRAGADAFFATLEDSPGRWRLLFGGASGLTGEHAVALEKMRFKTIETIAELLRHEAHGDVPDLQLEAFAHACSGVGERLGHWWLQHPDLERGDVVDLYASFVMAALSTLLPQVE